PHPLLLDAEPMGIWIPCSEQLEPSFIARNPYYQEFLLPRGIGQVVAARLVDTDALRGYMGVHRAPEQARFEPADLDGLVRIGPHLRKAAEIYCRFAAMAAEHTAGRASMDCAALGIVLVDASSRLLYANPAGEALLKEE